MDDLLNRYQKNSVRVSLRKFEENLREALSVLEGAEVEGILFQRKFYLSLERQVRARQMITAALDQIRTLKEHYGFEVDEQNLARSVAAEMSISWENLMDARSKGLAGYGQVDPRVGIELEPVIRSLAETALKLSLLFEVQEEEDPPD